MDALTLDHAAAAAAADVHPALRAAHLLSLASSFLLAGVYISSSHLSLPLVLQHLDGNNKNSNKPRNGAPAATKPSTTTTSRPQPAEAAAKAFATLYRKGFRLAVPLALLSGVSSLAAASAGPAHPDTRQRALWLASGAAALAALAWTRATMAGTIGAILAVADCQSGLLPGARGDGGEGQEEEEEVEALLPGIEQGGGDGSGSEGGEGEEVARLLRRWGRLNAVRSKLALLAGVLGGCAVFFSG